MHLGGFCSFPVAYRYSCALAYCMISETNLSILSRPKRRSGTLCEYEVYSVSDVQSSLANIISIEEALTVFCCRSVSYPLRAKPLRYVHRCINGHGGFDTAAVKLPNHALYR